MAEPGKPWIDRMAEELSKATEGRYSVESIKGILEAAGEIRAVRLKIMLGRCYEMIGIAKTNECIPQPDSGFLDEIAKEAF